MNSLSELGAKELTKLLAERRYIHMNSNPLHEKNELPKDKTQKEYSIQDTQCRIVPISAGFMNKDFFIKKILLELELQGGRASQQDLASALDTNSFFVQQCMSTLISPDERNNANKIIMIGGNVYVAIDIYMEQMGPSVWLALAKAGGCISFSQLANEVLHLPLEVVVEKILDISEKKEIKIFTMGGVRMLCTLEWEKSEHLKIRAAFETLLEPILVDTIAQMRHWDVSYILKVVRNLCTENKLNGILREAETSTEGAMYVPHIFLYLQRQSLVQQFSTQGFVTVEICRSMGIASMVNYVHEIFPKATALKEVMLDGDRIVNSLIPVLQDAITEESFCDLTMHVPESLLKYEADLLTVIEKLVVPQIEGGGQLVSSQRETLFISSSMIEKVNTKLLPSIIEEYAKVRAEFLYLTESMKEVDAPEVMDSKRGRKSKRKKKEKKTSMQYGAVPLKIVAHAVLEAYPALADIQEGYGEWDSDPSWEVDDEENHDVGPIFAICRQTIYNSKFVRKCEIAIKAEVERLKSEKFASSIRNRKDGAAKRKSREAMFEESFTCACHQLQIHAKVLDFVKDEKALNILRCDFLRSNCATFADRISQYCFFRNELEDEFFKITYQNETAKDIEHISNNPNIPTYCQSISRSCQRFPKPFLSCIPNDDQSIASGGKVPLPILRKVLSGSLGVILARLWTKCGCESYDNPEAIVLRGQASHTGKDIDDFISFVQENSLNICGIPFKTLDKKSEKQFLFARRQELTTKLQEAFDPVDVLELSIMLLCQQLRNLVVSGPHLIGPILHEVLLISSSSKKLPVEIADAFVQLAEQVQQQQLKENSTSVDQELVQKVKECGLSRDIQKHKMT